MNKAYAMSLEERKKILSAELSTENDPSVIAEVERILHAKKKSELPSNGPGFLKFSGALTLEEADEMSRVIEKMFENDRHSTAERE